MLSLKGICRGVQQRFCGRKLSRISSTGFFSSSITFRRLADKEGIVGFSPFFRKSAINFLEIENTVSCLKWGGVFS